MYLLYIFYDHINFFLFFLLFIIIFLKLIFYCECNLAFINIFVGYCFDLFFGGQDLLGDEGVLHCRSLLDGMEGRSETYLQQMISEGRCVVCNTSTFEEDMQMARNSMGGNGTYCALTMRRLFCIFKLFSCLMIYFIIFLFFLLLFVLLFCSFFIMLAVYMFVLKCV